MRFVCNLKYFNPLNFLPCDYLLKIFFPPHKGIKYAPNSIKNISIFRYEIPKNVLVLAIWKELVHFKNIFMSQRVYPFCSWYIRLRSKDAELEMSEKEFIYYRNVNYVNIFLVQNNIFYMCY